MSSNGVNGAKPLASLDVVFRETDKRNPRLASIIVYVGEYYRIRRKYSYNICISWINIDLYK